MLLNWQMRPQLTEGGMLGISLLQQAVEAGDPFAVVLLDAMMPDMDGFAVAETIRSTPGISSIPIILLTSADVRERSARCRELGTCAYLMKPVKQDDLRDAIKHGLSVNPRKPSDKMPAKIAETCAPAPKSETQPDTTGRLRILLAEDNLTNQLLVMSLLKKRGHEVVSVGNGKGAVAAAATQRFDLIVMDVQMPEMNGLEAAAVIREREKATGSKTPILALTAHTMEGDRQRCIDAGMDAFIPKPINVSEFMIAIAKLVPCNLDLVPETPAPETQEDWLDARGLMERFDGDTELLVEATELFRQSYPKLISQLREAIEREDYRAVERTAHTIKGTVGNLGGVGTAGTALKLENMGRKQNLEKAMEACEALTDEIERLIPALTALV
jgi:CheY-like chemotaxis protein